LRALSGQNEVDPQAASLGCDTHQGLQDVDVLTGQGGELVHRHHQIGDDDPWRQAGEVLGAVGGQLQGLLAGERLDALGGGDDAGVGGEQAVDVGEQHEDVGGHQVGHEGGQAVVVAEAELTGGHRVVLVDDGDGSQ